MQNNSTLKNPEELTKFQKEFNQSIIDWKNSRPKLVTISDVDLRESVEGLIESEKEKLLGDYFFHTIYKKENGEKYALIYAEYYESVDINSKSIKEIPKKDGAYLHAKLKESKVEIDYFFIVPYFNFTLDSTDSYVLGSVVTNEL